MSNKNEMIETIQSMRISPIEKMAALSFQKIKNFGKSLTNTPLKAKMLGGGLAGGLAGGLTGGTLAGKDNKGKGFVAGAIAGGIGGAALGNRYGRGALASTKSTITNAGKIRRSPATGMEQLKVDFMPSKKDAFNRDNVIAEMVNRGKQTPSLTWRDRRAIQDSSGAAQRNILRELRTSKSNQAIIDRAEKLPTYRR